MALGDIEVGEEMKEEAEPAQLPRRSIPFLPSAEFVSNDGIVLRKTTVFSNCISESIVPFRKEKGL